MNSEYYKLTELVNNNLEKAKLNKLVFELEDNLNNTIYLYPYKKLLSIEDNKQFLYEAYYKILDRIIDDNSYLRLFSLLENNKITKREILKNLSNSEEARNKNTSLYNEDIK